MPAKGSTLLKFCIRALDENCYPNFKWVDRMSGLFALECIHQRNKMWKKEHEEVFKGYFLSCRQKCTQRSDLKSRFTSALRQSKFLKIVKCVEKKRFFKICSTEHLQYLKNDSTAFRKNCDSVLCSDGESLASPQTSESCSPASPQTSESCSLASPQTSEGYSVASPQTSDSCSLASPLTSEGCCSVTSPFSDLSSPASYGILGDLEALSLNSSPTVCDKWDDMPFEQDFQMQPEVRQGSVMNALEPPVASAGDVSRQDCCAVSAVSNHTSNNYREDAVLSKISGAIPESYITRENWEESVIDLITSTFNMDLKDMYDLSDDDFESLLFGNSEGKQQKTSGAVPQSYRTGENREESVNDPITSTCSVDLLDMMDMYDLSDDDFQSLLFGNSEDKQQKDTCDNTSVVPQISAAEPMETSSLLETTAMAFDQNAALPAIIWVPEGDDPNMTVLTYYLYGFQTLTS